VEEAVGPVFGCCIAGGRSMSAAVRAGYKMTEVGVIPEDWEASSIGSDSNWMSGGTPRRSNAEYWSGTIPWISGSTLKSVEISTSDQFLTAEGVAAGSKMAPVDSTLLLVRGSALHNEIRAGLVVAPVAFNQDVKALVPNANVEAKFLTYYILAHSDQLLKLVSSAGNSAGVLDTELVQNFKFLKPPLSEQRAIATALSDVDALLAKLDALIAKKRDLKVAAMQQLLTGQTRLPGFSGEWGVKRLGDVLKVRHGRSQHEVVVTGGVYPILATGGEIGRTNVCLYDRPSVLIGRKGTIDKPQYQDSPFWTVDTLFYTELFNSVHPKFIYFKFLMVDWRSYNEASGVPSLNASTIENIEVVVPKLEEQTAIATVLSDMDAELTALEVRRDKTRALKQGMMQELLTGRIRLV
jgi:type I restriction enzyme S subunit